MRVIVTGGGTGGHVYPALEVASIAQEEADLVYFGSNRGMEGEACGKRGFLFKGFDSVPVYSYKSLAGLKALAQILKASLEAKKAMAAMKPDIVFSTGGYSSAPVMRAAKALGVPLAIHACDTIPGRSLRMFVDYAKVVTSTFESTGEILGRNVVRTGHPIRRELREAVARRQPVENLVLVVGGSGGAKFLNEVVPKATRLLPDIQVVHSTGKAQYEEFKNSTLGLEDRYDLKPYLEAEEMAKAYRTSTLAIGRSGSTVSEFAMARLPSILIPLPTSADNHQHRNAQEFAEMRAASLVEQGTCTPESLAEEIAAWLKDETRRDKAAQALSEWDIPDATYRIWSAVKKAAQ
ncbi:MAG: UDP-N-acetylglucosamine--N-acetylmuramyl-(pentapeptide) pyrophosphoryl-undecaprenol N-acetylglucosamine transferase [Armatimonadetes bacterium]|nr:UDP-N-acetylglucosamine--N-acetylmuramyl-(pentapeptide) pyrophosphoryl-undecaprenol N-acetylglucosamine transferase [Armatimonadota bacterium]